MKKFLVLVTGLFLMTSAVTAQGFNTRSSEYKPYVSPGTSVSSNQQSYSVELGAYNKVSQYAAVVSFTNGKQSADLWSAGAIGYWKIANRRTENKVDLFATGQGTIDLNRYHNLTVTPGLAAQFNIWDSFSPQLSIGFPIGENSVLRNRPLGVVGGISVNIK